VRPPSRILLAASLILGATACSADATPTPAASVAPTPTTAPSEEPSASASGSPPPSASPSAVPDPPLSLDLPEGSDPRIVTVAVTPNVGPDGGTFTVVVSSAADERIDELVLRWPAGLEETMRLAPFAPSEARYAEGAPPLDQDWTKWVIGPGEQGEPAGTISVGWGPLLPGATLTVTLVVTRVAAGPVAFDFQLLAGNDLLTFTDGAPAELRIQVP
jgi:hypothetical protein